MRAESAVDIIAAKTAAKVTTTSPYPNAECICISLKMVPKALSAVAPQPREIAVP